MLVTGLASLVCISVAVFVLFNQTGPLLAFVESVQDEGLSGTIARAFGAAAQAGAAFWLCFIAAHFAFSALEASMGALWHTCNVVW